MNNEVLDGGMAEGFEVTLVPGKEIEMDDGPDTPKLISGAPVPTPVSDDVAALVSVALERTPEIVKRPEAVNRKTNGVLSILGKTGTLIFVLMAGIAINELASRMKEKPVDPDVEFLRARVLTLAKELEAARVQLQEEQARSVEANEDLRKEIKIDNRIQDRHLANLLADHRLLDEQFWKAWKGLNNERREDREADDKRFADLDARLNASDEWTSMLETELRLLTESVDKVNDGQDKRVATLQKDHQKTRLAVEDIVAPSRSVILKELEGRKPDITIALSSYSSNGVVFRVYAEGDGDLDAPLTEAMLGVMTGGLKGRYDLSTTQLEPAHKIFGEKDERGEPVKGFVLFLDRLPEQKKGPDLADSYEAIRSGESPFPVHAAAGFVYKKTSQGIVMHVQPGYTRGAASLTKGSGIERLEPGVAPGTTQYDGLFLLKPRTDK